MGTIRGTEVRPYRCRFSAPMAPNDRKERAEELSKLEEKEGRDVRNGRIELVGHGSKTVPGKGREGRRS